MGVGFFGRALAYTAGAKTQGVGTLHFHALINPDEFPAAAFEEEKWCNRLGVLVNREALCAAPLEALTQASAGA